LRVDAVRIGQPRRGGVNWGSNPYLRTRNISSFLCEWFFASYLNAVAMKKNIKKRVNIKKIAWLIVLSYVVNITALSILMLKVFYPYHRTLAFVVYGISWAIFIYALIMALSKKYNEHKKVLLRWLPFLVISLGLFVTLWMILSFFPVDNFEMARADKIALTEKMNSEQVYAENYIQKLRETEKLLLGQIKNNSLSALTLEDKNKTRELWRDYLNYSLALEEITNENRYFYQINYLTDRELNERSFMLAYATFLANYSSALNLVKQVEAIPLTETILNEEVASYGIPQDSYFRIQKNLLRSENMLQTIAGQAYGQKISQGGLVRLKQYAEQDFKNILVRTGKNPEIGFNGAIDYFEKNMFVGWFPVQKEVAERVGDTRIPLDNVVFIDSDKIKQIESSIMPGDVFLQRRNWYLSNAGLPGFWKHTVIYIGSLADLDLSFPPSELTKGLSMSEYIKRDFPKLYEELKDNKKRTLEAESEGVVSFALEKSMAADYAAVLRPKISQEEKLKALVYAFEQFGKPYDFNFDFLTDNSIVCSELFYKAYPMMGYKLRTVSGRMVLSSNHIAEDFDEKYEQQKKLFDLVYFIDADEKTKKSFFGDLESFRQSWKRTELDVTSALLLKQ
jgi:hypothetical protein